MNARQTAVGLYFVIIFICVCFVIIGITLIKKGVKNKQSEPKAIDNDFLHIYAQITDIVKFDTPQFSDIYDETGFTDGVKITYEVDGKTYEKICADMNFDEAVPIIVRRENPDEFSINLDEDDDFSSSDVSSGSVIGTGMIMGGFLVGGFFVYNLFRIISQ